MDQPVDASSPRRATPVLTRLSRTNFIAQVTPVAYGARQTSAKAPPSLY
jgi:hypothetical protein